MEDLSIGEVARRAGIQPSALRYYESIGLMPAPRRVSGRRRYDESAVRMLKIVQLAQSAGFSIAEIQVLLTASAAIRLLRPAGSLWRAAKSPSWTR